ncbi:MAG: hypothetical protein JJV95_05745 [Sulfurospirillum sp.]|nr:hypothetical protein [Sulfurospirillum sp.]MBL0703468.1 hypothetical protein [Sulfurospirillum sp.]
MSKLTVFIGSKNFDITLDEEFAKFFKEDFKDIFGEKRTIKTKELLYAYVQKSHNEFTNKQKYMQIVDKIDEII